MGEVGNELSFLFSVLIGLFVTIKDFADTSSNRRLLARGCHVLREFHTEHTEHSKLVHTIKRLVGGHKWGSCLECSGGEGL